MKERTKSEKRLDKFLEINKNKNHWNIRAHPVDIFFAKHAKYILLKSSASDKVIRYAGKYI